MKNINFKSLIISSVIVYSINIITFIASYFVPVMSDADLQANWVLSLTLIPAALLGAHIYYRKGHQTNGFILGVSMFAVSFLIDIIFTVPFFVMPYGGNHIDFFTKPSYWLLAVEYISLVAAYWQIERAVKSVIFVGKDKSEELN